MAEEKTRLIIENINPDIWRTFVGYCKMNNILAGDKLTEVLEQYLKQKQVLKHGKNN